MHLSTLLLICGLSGLSTVLFHTAHLKATDAQVKVLCAPALREDPRWNPQRAEQSLRRQKEAERRVILATLVAPAGIALAVYASRSVICCS